MNTAWPIEPGEPISTPRLQLLSPAKIRKWIKDCSGSSFWISLTLPYFTSSLAGRYPSILYRLFSTVVSRHPQDMTYNASCICSPDCYIFRYKFRFLDFERGLISLCIAYSNPISRSNHQSQIQKPNPTFRAKPRQRNP